MDWLYARLLAVSRKFWPQLADMRLDRQLVGVAEVAAFIYSAPLAVWGFIWLISATDVDLIRANWFAFTILLALSGIFLRLRFFFIIELRENRYGSSDGSMAGVVLWSAIFLFGPSAIWVSITWYFLQGIIILFRRTGPAESWILRRNLSMSLAGESLIPLLAINLYRSMGGILGPEAISFQTFGIALLAIGAYAVLFLAFWLPYILFSVWVQKRLNRNNPLRPLFTFFFLSIGLPQMVLPFAVLGAEIFSRDGYSVYLFFMLGILVVAALTRRLSLVGETNRFQYRALEKLEQFSRAVLNAPATYEALLATLEAHITNMFPSGKIVAWRFPDQVLFNSRPDWHPELNTVWPWLFEQHDVKSFLAREKVPWLPENSQHNPIIISPILDAQNNQAYGGVYLELHTLAQPWNRRTINTLVPAVKTLADQIASAFNRLDLAEQSLDLDRVNQELRLAGSIQSSLLPYTFPAIPGWQLAVSLTPAGAMAGDFFDVIPLSDGRIGIVIADVLDKGLGPALYMALSRTLIRTYATEFDLQPSAVIFATNERILKDTQANLFVTTFYGVLEPATGKFTYSNAGHNPPYLLQLDGDQQKSVVSLKRTGIPIGIDEDATWEHVTVQIEPGACLLLYTDGIPEAENVDGQFFGEGVLVEVAKKGLGLPAEEMQSMVLKRVYEFLDGHPPTDDMTLVVLTRDS